MPPTNSILIIGAGAAGLIAAREICRKGFKVTILEARDRIGGRIFTLHEPAFSMPIEAGAEFIHGDLPITLSLLEEYKIKHIPVGGSMWQFRNGTFRNDHEVIEDGELLTRKLKEVNEDMTVEVFLETYFNDPKYDVLKKSVKGFIQGYDAADIRRASTLAFKEEWLSTSWEQYRIEGGYGKLMDEIENECRTLGAAIHLSETVKEIHWRRNEVEAISSSGEKYSASKVLITIPLGVLNEGGEAEIRFFPHPENIFQSLKLLEYGTVIKIALQFSHAFWKEDHIKKHAGKNLNDLGFLFTDAFIPTWWTQEPLEQAMLTGWFAGPPSLKFKSVGDEFLFEKALETLSYIFSEPQEFFYEKLTAWKIFNWAADSFSNGAYSYATPESKNAVEQLTMPVEDTLFFAGEGLGIDAGFGTVEAAFSSGIKTAIKMADDEKNFPY